MPEELAMTRHGALDCCVEGLLTFYLLLDVFIPWSRIRSLAAPWQGFNILVWLSSLLGGFAAAALVLGAVVCQAQSQRPCDSVCSEGLPLG